MSNSKLTYTLPDPEDEAVLESDREFAAAVIKAKFPAQRLIGTSEDLPVLQMILDGGPYTESAEAELIALGTSLGDLLAAALNLSWIRITDEYGSDLCLRFGQTSITIFPRDMIVKRIEQDEQPNLQELYDGVIERVQELVASGEYQ